MDNLATRQTAVHIANMGYPTIPATMEELAALQAECLIKAADDALYGTDEQVELENVCAAAFTMLTGIDCEEPLITDYCVKATSEEIMSYMIKLLQRVMNTEFHVLWAAGYGEPTCDTVPFTEIIESGNYSFESDELVALLALDEAGQSWTYSVFGERIVFTAIKTQ